MYVDLPEEDQVPGQDLVGKLSLALYGTREAAAAWQPTPEACPSATDTFWAKNWGGIVAGVLALGFVGCVNHRFVTATFRRNCCSLQQ